MKFAAADVRSPSDMIAIGDHEQSRTEPQGGLIIPLDSDEICPIGSALSQGEAQVGDRHNAGANMVFCDGHAEYTKQSSWIEPTDNVRRRWNNDNQPHPETW